MMLSVKKILVTILLFPAVIPCLAGSGWPSPAGGVYRIEGAVDLGGKTVTMEKGSVLDLTKGTLQNGTVIGQESSLSVSGDGEVMEGVILQGEWTGKVRDSWFRLAGNSPYWIVSNVCKFNEAVFTRDAYWMDRWHPILINRDSLVVHGNGVTLYMPSDKGDAEKGRWGYKYKKESLFTNPRSVGEPAGAYVFEDIHIRDNAEAIGKPGWGQTMDEFRIYYYFEVIGREVSYRNVTCDGQGILVKVYNYWQHIDKVEMEGCSVKAGQFAAEIASFPRDGFPGGTCDLVVIRNCRFHQYAIQPYVGLLSVVGETPTEQMLVEDCTFDATEKDGNLELSSVRHIVFRRNTMVNQFVNSYQLPQIESYEIMDNTFIFRTHRSNDSFKFGGREILFKNNRLVYETEDVGFITVTPTVQNLQMLNNVFDFSTVDRIGPSRTALSLSSLALTGGRLVMKGNQVVPPRKETAHRFIFRLPSRTEGFVNNRLQGVDIR